MASHGSLQRSNSSLPTHVPLRVTYVAQRYGRTQEPKKENLRTPTPRTRVSTESKFSDCPWTLLEVGRQAAETSGSSGTPNKRTYLVQAGGRLTGQSLHATQSSVAAPPQGANVAGDLPSVSPQLALLTLANT